jgi:hypothetical protein
MAAEEFAFSAIGSLKMMRHLLTEFKVIIGI